MVMLYVLFQFYVGVVIYAEVMISKAKCKLLPNDKYVV